MQEYDYLLVGGGTGGLRLSLKIAAARKKIAMIDPGVPGGTCLNTGCIPTKAMLQASHLYSQARELKEFGISVKDVSFNFKKLMERVRSFPAIGQEHIKKSLQKYSNLTYIKEHGSFLDPHTLQVGKKQVRGKKIIIATGAKNFVPSIDGLERAEYLTHESVLKLKVLPSSIIMIGGGYISMEFATFFHELGVKVSVLERLPRILDLLDQDILDELLAIYDGLGIEIYTNVNILAVEKKGNRKNIVVNDVRAPGSKKKILKTDEIFVATGRIPNTKELNLEHIGVKTDKRGGIIVNKFLQTTQKHIYALGDCLGKDMFAHAVKRESYVIFDNALKRKKVKMDFFIMPWAIFTHPPIAGVGISEKAALEQGLGIKVKKSPYRKAGRASINGKTRGFVKVIEDKKGKLVGAFIIGERADDLIHEFVSVMNSSSPCLEVINKAIHIHPTLAEVMEGLR